MSNRRYFQTSCAIKVIITLVKTQIRFSTYLKHSQKQLKQIKTKKMGLKSRQNVANSIRLLKTGGVYLIKKVNFEKF